MIRVSAQRLVVMRNWVEVNYVERNYQFQSVTRRNLWRKTTVSQCSNSIYEQLFIWRAVQTPLSVRENFQNQLLPLCLLTYLADRYQAFKHN